MKKSGILLAVLLLATFTLAFSSAVSAQAPQAPAAAVQQVQPAAPLPDFLTAPAVETPAVAPANGSDGIEWLGVEGPGKPACRCSTNSQCNSTTHFCCWFPNQKCGVCCIA
jgi:hypothetical protein